MSRWEGKYVIGLTGNIAVGKSVVRRMLQQLGAYTIDADGLSHQAMEPGAPAYKPVVATFGNFILDSENRINRAMLGQIVFSNPTALAKLEAIVHPIVNQVVNVLIKRAKQPVIVIEAIKLLEGNLASAVDTVWVVDATPQTQLRRLVEKRGMSPQDAQQRVAAQNAQSDKVARANYVIKNDGNVEETFRAVQTGWNNVLREIGVQRAPAPERPPTVKPIQPRPPQQTTPPPAPPQPSTAPPTDQQPPVPVAPPAQTTAESQDLDLDVRRGMPSNAEAIAQFITMVSEKTVERMDIMMAFGEKSYLLAQDKDERMVGLIGWQVENLITRVDEVYLTPDVPQMSLVRTLVEATEDASRDLQSEVSFIFLPKETPQPVIDAFLKAGYDYLKLETIKFPAWREAAHERMSSELVGLMKQLREDRVMKPI
ncbi:MAG: dephospho-CoA kinase [Chloroflexi bacterium]|nr:dephospho-CoA kinase [Chloroflexota bacterium]